MELVQSRIVTDDVEMLGRFYADLVGTGSVTFNEYYVEIPAGPVTIGLSRSRFTEEQGAEAACTGGPVAQRGELILDFVVDDVDAEYERIDALGVEWVLTPTTQPWGRRSMLLRDPEGHLVNVSSRREVAS